jgi:uncharacterized protein DUF6221
MERMTLAEFILARADEDEAGAAAMRDRGVNPIITMSMVIDADRMFREARAKARMVAAYRNGDTTDLPLRILAAVYETHPDYDNAWTI